MAAPSTPTNATPKSAGVVQNQNGRLFLDSWATFRNTLETLASQNSVSRQLDVVGKASLAIEDINPKNYYALTYRSGEFVDYYGIKHPERLDNLDIRTFDGQSLKANFSTKAVSVANSNQVLDFTEGSIDTRLK